VPRVLQLWRTPRKSGQNESFALTLALLPDSVSELLGVAAGSGQTHLPIRSHRVENAERIFGGQVLSITQTTDGYIWVGTGAGLFRFDGVRFVSWNSQEGELPPSTFIAALLAARDGSLWIGTDAGLATNI